MTDRQPNTPALEAKLLRLEQRMEEALQQSRRRRLTTGVALGAILLGATAYLWWLSRTIREFAEPATLVELAAVQVEPLLDAEADRFSQTLTDQAPAVMDQMEKLILNAPAQLAREAEGSMMTLLRGGLESLEQRAYDVASTTLANTLVKAHDEGVDLTDDAQLDAVVDAAAPTLEGELTKAVEKIHAEYTDGAADVASAIEVLAAGDGSGLDATKKIHRELLLTGLALIKKMEADPRRAPLQNLIEGRSLPTLDRPAAKPE